jgi:hypothetical protein
MIDVERMAKDLPAEARGLTRSFFETIHREEKLLERALNRAFNNKSGRNLVASRRRTRRLNSDLAGTKSLLHVEGQKFKVAHGREIERRGLDTKPDERAILVVQYELLAKGKAMCDPGGLFTVIGHAVARWFERAPASNSTTEGLLNEFTAVANDMCFRVRLLGMLERKKRGLLKTDDRIGIISPTSGGVWMATMCRMPFWPEIDGDGGLLFHTFFGGPDLTSAHADNCRALIRFVELKGHLLSQPCESWPNEWLDELVRLNDPTIWMPKNAT